MTDPIWTRRSTQMVEVSTAQPDADPVWQDISPYVLMVGSGQAVSISRGRQTELTQADPSRLSVVLNNSDGRFTPSNPTSPYVAWWKQGRRIRWREKLGPWVFDLFDGYLQLPEVVIQVAGKDQILTVSAVDRLARLDQPGTEFASTVAAHIMTSARNDALIGYWSLFDTIAPIAPLVGTNHLTFTIPGSSISPAERLTSIDYASGVPLPGDDVSPVHLTWGLNAGTPAGGPFLSFLYSVTPVDTEPTITAGETLTVVGWLRPDALYSTLGGLSIELTFGALGSIDVYPVADASGFHWHFTYFAASTFNDIDSANGSASGTGRWTSIAVRWGFNPNLIELWVDGSRYTSTFANVVASAKLFLVNFGIDGALAHQQIYVGDPADFTFDDYLLQREVALHGLERQTTGARVDSLLDYAGVGPSQRDVDPGAAVMMPASLAGKTPLTALHEPERTERGLLFTDGRGRVVFRDRVRRYNL